MAAASARWLPPSRSWRWARAATRGTRPRRSAQQKNAPPTVAVSQPVQRDIVEWDEYTGRFDAVETVEMRARVSGHLTEVRFKDGQLVKQGDLLFVIDPRPFERALEQARAELFAATTKVENANLDIVRGKPLVERKIISDKTFDDRMSIVRDAQAAVKVAEAKVKSAELDLSFTRIDFAHHRPHQPHPGDGGQLGERRRHGQRDAAHHHRQPGPDLHLLRRQREQLHQVQAAGRARRRAPAPPTSALPSRSRCPTSAASRTRRASTFSTTGSTRAPARCAPGP